MPEVRNISADEQAPKDTDHVVIDRTPGGKFLANGYAEAARGDRAQGGGKEVEKQ